MNRARRKIIAAALLAGLIACGEETDEQASRPEPTEQARASEKTTAPQRAPMVDFDDLPPIPSPDIEKLNEAAVRDELREARDFAMANQTIPRAVGNFGMACFVYDFDNEARDCFLIATALAPRAHRWAYYMAMAHENVGDQDLAIEAYERAIELDPSYQPAYVRLAKLMLDVDTERACELYEIANELMPDEARATWGLAQCARNDGDLQRAEALYRKAIRLEPTYAEAHFGLAQVLARTGRREEARMHFSLQEAGKAPSDYRDPLAVRLALTEGGTSAIQREATSRASQGDVPGAIMLLKDSLVEYPDHPGLRLQLAQIYLAAQRLDLAEEQIALVREELPDNVGARSMLAYIHLLENDRENAETLLREILEDAPEDAASNWQLGRILIERGDADEAMPYLTKGADLQAFKPEIQIQMAQIQGQLGQPAEAAEYLRRAAIAQQGNEELIAEAERLEAIAEQRAGESP